MHSPKCRRRPGQPASWVPSRRRRRITPRTFRIVRSLGGAPIRGKLRKHPWNVLLPHVHRPGASGPRGAVQCPRTRLRGCRRLSRRSPVAGGDVLTREPSRARGCCRCPAGGVLEAFVADRGDVVVFFARLEFVGGGG